MSNTAVSGADEIMLFGVRVTVDSMRKCVSMNNLSQYEHPHDAPNNKEHAAGYASADEAPAPLPVKLANPDRKRGVPWTEEEHKLFLLGLQKVGKGDWRGISKNFVKTRTSTQVASHAQKYFLRRANLTRRRRRSSLFDITTDTVSAAQMEEEQIQHQDNMSHSCPIYPATATETPESSNRNGYPMMPMYSMAVGSGVNSVLARNQMEKLTLGQENVEQNEVSKLACTIPAVPDHKASSSVSDISSNTSSIVDPPTLSLGLSLSSDQRQKSPRHTPLHAVPCFNNEDSIITVA